MSIAALELRCRSVETARLMAILGRVEDSDVTREAFLAESCMWYTPRHVQLSEMIWSGQRLVNSDSRLAAQLDML